MCCMFIYTTRVKGLLYRYMFIQGRKEGRDMANNAVINSVYNHYLTSYSTKGSTPFDTHKKSELRSVYNSMVKINKEAPLFLPVNSQEANSFLVGIKESAGELKDTIGALGGLDQDSMLNNKVAFSSNKTIANATFIGTITDDFEEAPSFDLSVESLASTQKNLGNFLPSSSSIAANTYSFDINLNDISYEFQFQINENDTTLDIQNRLSRLITNANIGVTASTLEDSNGNSALLLESTSIGKPLNSDLVFSVSDDHTSKSTGIVEYLGLGETTQLPLDASFTLNGTSRTSHANEFTVENTYRIQLQGVSDSLDDVATIGLKPDTEAMVSNIKSLVDGYNQFLDKAYAYEGNTAKPKNLISEVKSIASIYMNELDAIGLSISDEGHLSVEDTLLTASTYENDAKELLDPIKQFANSLVRKTYQVALNPMSYMDRTVVAYKNPGKNLVSPYVTSNYSGMMFNGYC